MMRRTLILVLLAGIVLLLALWTLLPADQSQVRHLPDGSMLTLKTVTYGTRHKERVGNRWKDYLLPILSEEIAKKLDCNYVATGGNNALVFWFEHVGIAAGAAPRLRAATFDEHGCEFRVAESRDARYRMPKRGLLLIQFEEFPRRGKTIGLRLYQARTNGGFAKLTEFALLNPDRRTSAAWQPEPQPITKTVSNVDFTLVEVKGGVYGKSRPPQPPVPGEDCGALLRFRIAEKGRPTSAWGLAGITGLSDAFGQTVGRGGYAMSGGREGEFNMVIAGGLCVEEAAWRLNVEFAREKDFASHEVWQVKGIPVPDESSYSTIDATNTIHGVELRVCGIYGKKCSGPNPRRSVGDWPVVYLVAVNLSHDLDLKLLDAVDDRGRKVSAGGSARSSVNHVYSLNLATDARSVDATFAVTKRVAVEYLVKPSRMTEEEIKKLRKEMGYQ